MNDGFERGTSDGFERGSFTHEGVTRTHYRRGSGPPVIIMPELPGFHPELVEFANVIADAGFTVVLPELIGELGRPVTLAYGLESVARLCLGREFRALAANRSSPITIWLRALCRSLHAELGGRGVGAVGMCLSGNFGLAMMMEPALLAPVLSQPSLPLPLGAARKRGLHLSPEELENAKARVARGDRVLGLRFSDDPWCPPERFARLRAELGDGFEAIEIPSSEAGPSQNPAGPHSVLAADLVDEEGHPTRAARDRVIAFLRERLA